MSRPGDVLEFRKYHGIGNDFVVLDGLDGALPVARLESPALATLLCDRHRGIGADGLLLVLPPRSPGAQAWMRVINADGSEAEMCGNGIRCVARTLHDHRPELRQLEQLQIDTGAGLLCCQLRLGAGGEVQGVRVDMGRAALDRAELPMLGQGQFVEQPLDLDRHQITATAVSMGNPHLVSFVDQDPRPLAESLGPLYEHHPRFPNRTNVEFARRLDQGLELWVWERGCGITQACGTGACATAAAAVVTGRHPAGQPLPIKLPGGTLTIQVEPELKRVWMEGPAVEVFWGRVELPSEQ